MNPISAFFIEHIAEVYFFYGLSFFVLGVVLALASRSDSELPIVRSLGPLALFGILHGIHEWVEMFQWLAHIRTGRVPGTLEEALRVALLVLSFAMLLVFGARMQSTETTAPQRSWRFVWFLLLLGLGVWGLCLLWLRPSPMDAIYLADVLSRYLFAIPGALLGARGLMAQQHSFREQNLRTFGRDLVSAATALILYGVVGQVFVRQTALPPSTYLNSALFLNWFGIPVQLFRGVMATVILFFMVRALRAFEVEARRRLEEATRSRILAQERALEAERSAGREREQLNLQLEARARELSLLLELSNMIGATGDHPEPLTAVLRRIVKNLSFSDAGMIICDAGGGEVDVQAHTGYATTNSLAPNARYGPSLELGKRCLGARCAVCRHADGAVLEFDANAVILGKKCWSYPSPTLALALPLKSQQIVNGAVVFARTKLHERTLEIEELNLMVGIVRQLELSLETTRLYRLAQEREETLEHLLYQVVGAQEAERTRIARELHDATGQSLSAIGLGLRGVANTIAKSNPEFTSQTDALQQFAADALGELRRIIADLRPPQLDELGLAAALRWYVQSFRQRTPQTQITLNVAGDAVRLPAPYETVIFRVVQEALTNVAKHAQAAHAWIVLEMKAGDLVVTIQDDGRGFDVNQAMGRRGQSASWGLLGIRERTALINGRYELKSAPNQGTLLRISVPTTDLARLQSFAAHAPQPESQP